MVEKYGTVISEGAEGEKMSEDVEKLLAGFKGFNKKVRANPKMTEEEIILVEEI